MSFINRIPRGLRVLVVMAVLAVLIWQFALGTDYFYYSIGAAVLLTLGAIILIYKPFKSAGQPKAAKKAGAVRSKSGSAEDSAEGDLPQTIDIAEDYTDTPPAVRAQADRSVGTSPGKPTAGPALPTFGNSNSGRQAPKPTVAEVARKNLQSARSGPANSRMPSRPAAAEMKGDYHKSSKPLVEEEVPAEPEASARKVLDVKATSAAGSSTQSASFMSKIPRGLQVLIPMAVFGILIWRFAAPTAYYYYSIGAAVLLTSGIIVLVYKPFRSSKSARASSAGYELLDARADESLPDKIEVESDYTDSPSIMRKQPVASFRESVGKAAKPATAKPAAPNSPRDLHSTTREIWSAKEAAPQKAAAEKPVKAEVPLETDKITAAAPENETATPAIPLVEDETTLTEEDKNQLVNAVWYRCENPYCKYTSFLGVHHIVEEKDGGTNRLDNLIVLCPYCHDLAHRGEIPVEEMKDWICNRENRFKFKPDWKYF